ncbi:hypothetical protein QKC54_gp0011 [Megavirus baoshan]|uniref:DUF5889 domain-containing protein n=1 Tax=Megavirus baoshan TaxID=2496520 RepID=A0A3Q8U8V4_9VIRU|nr:hypothetical protein QKC54_gp0002 [Megavirus baoshan]YP_010789320.1 hypothetical protein QKC54_gp0011 [Megavirus baoshan]AZL89719.1 hypothetical protein Mb1061 [Megavirus baoshan]UFX99694.1 hypothetical protein Mb0002 [Megavirus baoshan]
MKVNNNKKIESIVSDIIKNHKPIANNYLENNYYKLDELYYNEYLSNCSKQLEKEQEKEILQNRIIEYSNATNKCKKELAIYEHKIRNLKYDIDFCLKIIYFVFRFNKFSFDLDNDYRAYSWNDLLSTKYLHKKIEMFIPYKQYYNLGKRNIINYHKTYCHIRKLRAQQIQIEKKLGKINNQYIKDVTNICKNNKYIQDGVQLPNKINYSKGTKKYSNGEKQIMKYLDKINNLYYYYGYKWPFCRNKNVLEYDFYCMILINKCFYHFVIEFDGGQHFKTNNLYNFEMSHTNDIIKQYYAASMNVHMLRLNDKLNIKKEIKMFIKKIQSSNEYIITNSIEPISELFTDTDAHNGLECFHNFCDEMTKNDEPYNFSEIPKLCSWYKKNIRYRNNVSKKSVPKKYYDIRPKYMKQKSRYNSKTNRRIHNRVCKKPVQIIKL